MRTKILKAVYGSPEKPLRLGEFKIPCYVLDNEKRVLSQTELVRALGMGRGGSSKGGGDRLVNFLSGKAINPFISKELTSVTNEPLKFKREGKGAIVYGYEATVLADICEAVLKAREQGQLQKQQYHIADRCEQLVRGFARVGIIALVDEATGYQYVRDRDELHKILTAYISPELMSWTKRFPDEFYKEIFRLNGWQYNPMTPKRPSVVGTWTNKLIYEQLPPGVLEELKKQTPKDSKGRRKHRLHQRLTEEIGNPHLERQLAAVMPIMRLSTTWRKFKENFAKAFKTGQQNLELVHPSHHASRPYR